MNAAPDPAALDQLLRRCVECGLCLPTCATWAASGNEVLSPRGRLVLMQEILESGGDADPGALESFDRCIGCRACEAVCPSGVPYSLFEHGKDLAAEARRRGSLQAEKPSVPRWLLDRLDRPSILRTLGALAPLAAVAPRPLARLADSMPTAPQRDGELVALLDGLAGPGGVHRDSVPADVAAPGAGEGVEIAFFSGCANAGLMPGTSRRLIDLLNRCGCRVTIPAGQGCCGALAGHTGRTGDRERRHEQNRRAFVRKDDSRWIIAEAAGCGLELKNQGEFGRAEVLDATEALQRLGLPPLRPVPVRVVYHAACHLEHGQGVCEPPRELLARIPDLDVVEPEDAALCCGSGGAWSLEHPDLAAAIGASKAQTLLATGAQLVVTTNPGCLGQIRVALKTAGRDLPILPLSDLIWYASLPAGG